MPERKPMTLDRLARMVRIGFQNTEHRFAQVDGQLDKLARAAQQEFTAIRTDMATSAELAALRDDARIFRRDMDEGFFHATNALKAMQDEVKEVLAMDAELTELRVRVKRLEKKVGIAA